MSRPVWTTESVATSTWSSPSEAALGSVGSTSALQRGGALGSQEVRRRLLHMLPGLLPFLLWVIPHRDPWGPILADVAIALTVAIVGTALLSFRHFTRPTERDWRAAVLGYAFPVLLTLSFCRGREELGVMTLAILAFGDGSATLGGLTFGGRRLPWNSRKTWTGLGCFMLAGTTMASIMLWGEARPTISWTVAIAVAGSATLVAAVLETLPSRLNDNLRVGLSASIVGSIVYAILLQS